MRRSAVYFIIGAATLLLTSGCGQAERKSVVESIPMEDGKPVYSESAAATIDPVNYIDSSYYSVNDGDYYAVIYPGHSSETSFDLDLYYCDQYNKNDICKLKYGDTISTTEKTIQVDQFYLQSEKGAEDQDEQSSMTGIIGATINGGVQNDDGITLKYITSDSGDGYFCPVDADGNPITYLIGKRELEPAQFISYTGAEANGSTKSVVGYDQILEYMLSDQSTQWSNTYLHINVANMQITKIVNENTDLANND